MKLPERTDKRTMLQKEIAAIELQMSQIKDKDSDEYRKLQEALSRNYEMELHIREVHQSGHRAIDPNTLLTIGGGIAEILLIMHHERLHVIATKAFSRVIRGRI